MTIKIGILTYFRPINHGAYLQAYALSHRLNQEDDIQAELINYHMPAEDRLYDPVYHKKGKNFLKKNYLKKCYQAFRSVLPKQILSSPEVCGDIDDFIEMADGKYDVVIAGSDEIWKVDGYRLFPTPYFLSGELHAKKMSYAASGRTPFSTLSSENVDILKGYLEDFSYIGVRDQKTKSEVEKLCPNQTVHLNFDPSFIYDFQPNRERGRELIQKYYHIKGNKKIVAMMYGEKIRANPSFIKYIQDTYGQNCKFISLYAWNIRLKNAPKMTPFEWIDIIAASDGMITSFFHGTCFSFLTGTPFYAIDSHAPNTDESKIYDLLQKLNLTERYSFRPSEAMQAGKMDNFFAEVNRGVRLDPSSTKRQAQEEFTEFVNGIRKIACERR